MTPHEESPEIPAYVLTERTHLRLPSKPHWIEPTVEWLRQKAVLAGACQETRSRKLLVALHEAISNAIVHGNLEVSSALRERDDDSFARTLAARAANLRFNRRVVEIHIECDASQCRWTITDEGQGFDVDGMLRRRQNADAEGLLSSGRGIVIMKSFLDMVRWDQGGRRVILGLARTSGAERRRELRAPQQKPVKVAPIRPDGSVDWNAAYEAIARDCSQNGIGLFQEKLAQSGRILIGITVDDEVVYVPAEVRHCRNVAGEIVELGCRFQTELPAAAMTGSSAGDPLARVQTAITQLLQHHAKPQVTREERRKDQRVVYTERIDILPTPQAAPIGAFARDLSKGGVAFIVHTTLPEYVTIVLKPRDGTRPLHVRARVTRCSKIIEGFYDVGAQFLELENLA